MKYLCLGYFNPQEMDARPKSEIDAVMQECWSHMDEFHASGRVLVDAGLELQTKCLRRANGALRVTDGPFTESKEMVGSVFILEARDMDEAIGLASLHPSMRVGTGEPLGWRLEIRPIHHFQSSHPEAE
jgi:hypothetical protein